MEKKIWIRVTLAHLAIIACLFLFSETKKTAERKTIRVRTVVERPAPVIVKSMPKPKPKAKPKSKPKPKPTPTPKSNAVTATKKAAPTSKVDPKLLRALSANLETITENKTPTPAEKIALSIPDKVSLSPSPKIEIDSTSFVEYLQQRLELPDHGHVKISLTIRKDGSVASVEVIESGSSENRNYLLTMLPKLTFPFPEIHKKGESEKKITLNFTNEI